MNLKKYLIITFGTAISMWILAGIWHQLIMVQFYASQTHATHEGTAIIFVAYLILGGLMTYIYPKGYSGGKPLLEGFRFGLLMGLLWVFPHELAMSGAHGEPLAYVFKNALWHMVEQGAGGIVLALLHARLIQAK